MERFRTPKSTMDQLQYDQFNCRIISRFTPFTSHRRLGSLGCWGQHHKTLHLVDLVEGTWKIPAPSFPQIPKKISSTASRDGPACIGPQPPGKAHAVEAAQVETPQNKLNVLRTTLDLQLDHLEKDWKPPPATTTTTTTTTTRRGNSTVSSSSRQQHCHASGSSRRVMNGKQRVGRKSWHFGERQLSLVVLEVHLAVSTYGVSLCGSSCGAERNSDNSAMFVVLEAKQ